MTEVMSRSSGRCSGISASVRLLLALLKETMLLLVSRMPGSLSRVLPLIPGPLLNADRLPRNCLEQKQESSSKTLHKHCSSMRWMCAKAHLPKKLPQKDSNETVNTEYRVQP